MYLLNAECDLWGGFIVNVHNQEDRIKASCSGAVRFLLMNDICVPRKLPEKTIDQNYLHTISAVIVREIRSCI